MLKIFDFNKNPIGYIWKYKDLKKESELSTGDKTLSFTYLAKTHDIREEYYIQDETDEYVVKEVNLSSDGFPQIVAKLNLEELEGNPWEKFTVTDSTIEEAARLAITGTGWRVGECTVTKRRSAGILNADTLTVIDKLCTVFMCERIYDTKNKTVSFYEKIGEDKGMYFIRGLNLKKISEKSDTYDYYTRIQPVGKDGLTIESVNNGKKYLENYQYSNKVKTYLWIDESYEDPQALKEDAEAKLADISKPLKSYSADIVDLAKRKPEYSILSFGLGDIVTLIDNGTGIKDEQRIVKLTEYPQDPDKNTCEIANTALTFEELQQKIKEAADIINAVMTDDGQFTGEISIYDILQFEEGVYNSNAVTELRQDYVNINGELVAVKATIGQIETNYIKAEEADLKYATIEQLNATNQTVHTIEGDYADFKVTTTSELAAQRAIIDDLQASAITTEYLEANYAQIDLANIETGCITTAMLGTGVVGTAQIADGSITDAKIVELTANKITAGTLSVERLEIRGSTNSIVYGLNNITGALQAQNVDTLNGEILTPRTITADKIVTNAITANEIASKTITANEIAAGAITAEKIQAEAVKAIHIESGTITATQIKANAITANEIASKTITANEIAAGAITANEIAAKTITGNEIAAGTIKAVNIDVANLFAQDITAKGTIRGVNLVGATGSFSGMIKSTNADGTVSATIENGSISLITGAESYCEISGQGIRFPSAQGSSYSYMDIFGQEGIIIREGGIQCAGDLTVGGIIGNVISGQYADGYWGMGSPDKNYSAWIRTTSSGLIPYRSGGASSLGTASWPFNYVYAVNVNSTGTIIATTLQAGGSGTNGGLELYHATPFIDFHYGRSTDDYTHRIIADDANRLRVTSAFYVNGRFSAGEHILLTTHGRALCGTCSGGSTEWIAGIETRASGTSSAGVNSVRIGQNTLRTYVYTASSVYSNGAWNNFSDRRLKEEFTKLDKRYLNMFDNLNPTLFLWKDKRDTRKQAGYVAQEVLAAMNAAGISESENTIVNKTWEYHDIDNKEAGGMEIYSLEYEGIDTITAYALQDTRTTVKQHTTDIDDLKKKYTEALTRIALLEAQNQIQQQQINQLQGAA